MSQPRRCGRRRLVPIVIALLAAMVVAGCDGPAPPTGRAPTPAPASGSKASSPALTPSPTTAPSAAPTDAPQAGPSGSLLLLSGRAGTMALERVAADQQRQGVPLPDPDIAWISTDASGRALATTRDGRAFLSTPITGLGGPGWRAVIRATPATGTLPGPFAFGTLTNDGSRAAFVAADYGTNRGFDVAIVDTATGTTVTVPIARPAEGAPPAWIGDRLVLLTRERGDGAGVTILDPTTGSLTDGPGPVGGSGRATLSGGWTGRIAGLAVSADGSTVAVGGASDQQIEIGPAAAWLAGTPTEMVAVPLEPDAQGGRTLAWLALGPTGGQLAIVRTNADGDAVGVTVHTARGQWRAGPPIALPVGAVRAVVAWLP